MKLRVVITFRTRTAQQAWRIMGAMRKAAHHVEGQGVKLEGYATDVTGEPAQNVDHGSIGHLPNESDRE